MKKIYTLIAIFAAMSAANAQATLPVYEPFDYPTGAYLHHQTGYVGFNSGDSIAIVSGSLQYPDLPASIGNKINFAGAGMETKYDIETVNSDTIYYSFLITINDISGVTDSNGGYFAGFGASNTLLGNSLWTKQVNDTVFKFGAEVRTSATGVTWSDDDYNIGETYLVVGSYTFVNGTQNDVSQLWINPDLGLPTEPTATITDQWSASNDLSSISHFFFRRDSATETPDVDIDELRIGTSWTDVTPTIPASLKKNEIQGLSLFPNPATEMLYITSNTDSQKDVQLFDMTGKKVLNVTTTSQINIAHLRAGIYIAKITENGKTATRKIIIK